MITTSEKYNQSIRIITKIDDVILSSKTRDLLIITNSLPLKDEQENHLGFCKQPNYFDVNISSEENIDVEDMENSLIELFKDNGMDCVYYGVTKDEETSKAVLLFNVKPS